MKKMTFTSIVMPGQGIGKKLGLPPTINVDIADVPPHLLHGIYVVRVITPAGTFGGAAHFGPRPAVHAGISFEVHCFGLDADLRGQSVSIEMVKKLRDVQDFAAPEALKEQIAKDIAQAKNVLS